MVLELLYIELLQEPLVYVMYESLSPVLYSNIGAHNIYIDLDSDTL